MPMPPPLARKVCCRYSAAGLLGLGRLWPRAQREETLKRVRALPTYDSETDTVIVCRFIS